MSEGPGRLRAWLSAALDLVYPGQCRNCRETIPGTRALCDRCAASLPRIEPPFCETCSEKFPGAISEDFICQNCLGQHFSFEFARSGLMRGPLAMALVHEFKYQRHIDLGATLADMAAHAFEDPRLHAAQEEKWPLVPVPLHWRRLRWRQFNQAEEIARHLARKLDLPLAPVLRRTRATPTQTRLTRRERQRNLKGAFALRREVRGWPGAVLIDDVLTTGSTVNECARTLRRAGVEKVVVVTALRG